MFADQGIADFVANATLGPLDVAAMRSGVDARARARGRGPELARVFDVPAGRVYRPEDTAEGPVLVWLHGGGWSIGGVESFDRVSRRLAAASGVSVFLVDYRLAPEHPWPAAIDDAVEAIVWLRSTDQLGFRPTAVAVGGDSAGGTVAAQATLRLAREMPVHRPALLALCYANTDLAGDYPSRVHKGHGFGLDTEVTEFFNRQWVPDRAQWSAPGVSPLHSNDLGTLPATLVVTAEHDQLHDEGKAFADRVAAEHVEVRYREEPGLIHNFLMLDELSPAAGEAADRVARDVAEFLRA